MKKYRHLIAVSFLLPISTFLFIILSGNISFAQTDKADPGWPRIFEANGNKVVLSQPQLEEWVDNTFCAAKPIHAISNIAEVRVHEFMWWFI